MKKTGIGAVFTAAALALTGCAAPAATSGSDSGGKNELTTVRIGYIPGAHDVAQLFLADEEGYFAAEGIRLELAPFQTGISLSQALTGGSVDVGVMGAVIANFPAKGQGKIFLLNNQQVDIHQIWAAPGSGINSVKDLRGKSIATTTGTAADLVLQVALDEAGLTREDVKVVNLDMPSVANTFVTGGVDAASLWAPFDQKVAELLPDATLLTTAAKMGSPISGGWVASNDYFDASPKIIDGIVSAWQKANADLVADPAAAAKIFCPKIVKNMTQDVCERLYSQTDAYSNEEWAKLYKDGTALGWVAKMEDVFEQIGALKGATKSAKDYFDTTVFPRVLAP